MPLDRQTRSGPNLKGSSMTRTVLFANAQANGTSAGQRTPPSSSLGRQVLDSAKAILATLTFASNSGRPSSWLTPAIQRNMSVRAQRLMRADY
jgi:hypothetical protein